MMDKKIILAILIVFAVAISSCTQDAGPIDETSQNNGNTQVTGEVGSDSAQEPEAQEVKIIRIEAYDFGFDVDMPEINKGDRVKVVATSRQGIHGIAIPGLNVNLKPFGPGEEMSTEFVADQSGTFDYYCNVPCGTGHKSMKGSITIN